MTDERRLTHKRMVRNYIRKCMKEFRNDTWKPNMDVRDFCKMEIVTWNKKQDAFLVKAWDTRQPERARYTWVYGYSDFWRSNIWLPFNQVVCDAHRFTIKNS